MNLKDKNFQLYFLDRIHRIGRITLVFATISILIPGFYLYIYHNLLPPISILFTSVLAVWSFMGVLAFIEPVVYFPLIGVAGSYMSWLVGNVSNLRVPVSITANDIIGTKEGSPESEIISTIAIAGSIISSTLIICLGSIAFLPFFETIYSEGKAFSIAINEVLPSLFGAIACIFLIKAPRLAIVPLGTSIILAFFKSDIPFSIIVPPMVFLSIITARLMYKRGWISEIEK